VESGELANRSWQDYKAACDIIVPHFGKGRLAADLDPEDFAALRRMMAKKWRPVTLGNVIQRPPAAVGRGPGSGHDRLPPAQDRHRPPPPPVGRNRPGDPGGVGRASRWIGRIHAATLKHVRLCC